MKKVAIRDAWKHEASEFTPWLAQSDNLELLAESLGISELNLSSTEHFVGDFKLDILCTSGDEQVIIENQLNETDHKHLGQILAYAAGVGAKKVIWIAESFRPEHSAALEFLNENSTGDLAFFGVQIEIWQIDDSRLAPKFEVVIRPNEWAKTGRESAKVAANSSPTKQKQYKFWQELVSYLRKELPSIRPRTPRLQHWLPAGIGRSGFILSTTINTKEERFGVEVYIQGPSSKDDYFALHSQKASIEKALGFELDWQELPDANACRIATWLSNAPLDDERRWPEYIKWVSARLAKMDAVLRPIIRDLD